MKAEKLTQQYPERIKYVLNGETKYYTLEELRAYLEEFCRKNDTVLLEPVFQKILQNLRDYDGDPYGDEPEHIRKTSHKLEGMGFMIWT